MKDGNVQGLIRRVAADERRAAGGNDDHCLLSQNPHHMAKGKGRTASCAGLMPRIHQVFAAGHLVKAGNGLHLQIVTMLFQVDPEV